MFYLNYTLNFGIPPVLVFQLEVCYKVDRLLTGLTAQQKGTTARCYSNKTTLSAILIIYELIPEVPQFIHCFDFVVIIFLMNLKCLTKIFTRVRINFPQLR